MERVPVTDPLPLPCYGTEHDRHDPRCQQCYFQERCILTHGRRAKKIRLSAVKFDLMPEKLADLVTIDPDTVDIQGLYEQCHWAVYEKAPADRLDKWPRAADRLTAVSKELGCSMKVLMTSVMMASHAGSPDRDFYSNMLLGRTAQRKVELFRDACRDKFGFFDISTLNTLAKRQITTLEDRMLRSEVTFGSFVVGYKMRVGGEPYTEFYRNRELAMDPFWLAIEPTYKEIIVAHVKDPQGTISQRRHRFSVVQAMTELKRHKRKAVYTFNSRMGILPQALQTVLSQRGLSSSSFEVENQAITDVGRMWSRLGQAIQHLVLLRYIDGDTRSADVLKTY